jgi:DNA-binding response OmpR family regulator
MRVVIIEHDGKVAAAVREGLPQDGHDAASREALARDLWDEPARSPSLDHLIDGHILRLREMVHRGGLPDLIHTARGVRFVLRPQVD